MAAVDGILQNLTIKRADYVCVPVSKIRQGEWREIEEISLQCMDSNWQQVQLDNLDKHKTYPEVMWLEMPAEMLAGFSHVQFSYDSARGFFSFAGDGKQAVAFFKSLQKEWLPDLVPNEIFRSR